MYLPALLLGRALVLAAVFFGILLFSISGADKEAFAAEQVVLKYRILRESISVNELSTFAETGELSRPLQVNLKLARQNPEAVRRFLTQPVQVSPIFLDRLLNSPVGNVVLDELEKVVHTPDRLADRQALRAALVISASRDNNVTLIEVIQNYPTSQVEVEGDRLEDAYRQLQRLSGSWRDLLDILGG